MSKRKSARQARAAHKQRKAKAQAAHAASYGSWINRSRVKPKVAASPFLGVRLVDEATNMTEEMLCRLLEKGCRP